MLCVINTVVILQMCIFLLQKSGFGNGVKVSYSYPLLPPEEVENKPKYVTKAGEISEVEVEEESKKNIDKEPFVIAIDIGEKYLGLAYIDPKSPGTVIPLHPMERISVLIRKSDQKRVVGSEATRLFVDMKDEVLKDHVYRNEVKEKDVHKEGARVENSFQLKDILVEAIKDSLNLVLEKSKTRRNKEDIKLILSAADHWSIHSEQLKSDIVKQKNQKHLNLGKERIYFMKKIKTVPLFIREVQASSICLNFNIENVKFVGGTKYAVLNIGYGSCHLTFLEKILEENELDNVIGGGIPRSEWGDEAPEEKVWSHCHEILHEGYLTQINKEKIKSQFDLHHETIRKCQCDETQFEFKLIKTGKFMTKKKKDGIQVKDNGNTFILSFQWKLLKDCFKELVDKVDQVIENNRKDGFERYKVKFVFIVGGYNKLTFIQGAARSKWFPNITVFIPNDGGVCFAMGAASACARNLIK